MQATATKPRESDMAIIDHLSWSSLQAYSSCPRKFYYSKILKARPERTPAALIFGIAIHGAIERVHRARAAGRELPTLSNLLTVFDSERARVEQTAPAVAYGRQENSASLRATAARMLEAYLDHVREHTNRDAMVIGVEVARRFRLVPHAPPLEARLDLVELAGDRLIITDFKTSRARWNSDKERENVLQLIAYKHAASEIVRKYRANSVVLRFTVLTKTRRPEIQELEPVTTAKDDQRLRELVADTWRGIQAGVFPRREGWGCKGCMFRDRCLG